MTLAVSNLSARYGRIEVCRGIDLTVEPGEFLVVLGANGAGKSSLLGALAGVVASSGSIRLNGRRFDAASARRRAWDGMALVPERRRNLFTPLTVDENLSLGLRLLPRGEREAMRHRLYGLFPILEERSGQLAGMLSGGEQQMLAIAMAIARKPAVLLLDEPTQGLAPVILDELIEAIGNLRRLGISLLLAEQNVRFAAALADRYVALQGGEIVHRGRGDDLADNRGTAAAALLGASR